MSNLIDSLRRSSYASTAVRATLRRGLSHRPGTHVQSFAYVEPVLAHDGAGPKQRKAYYIAAALWAGYSSNTPSGAQISFAQACASLYASKKVESFSKAFVALLDANEEQIQRRLSSLLGQLTQYNIDFGQLHDDLLQWGHRDKFVQIRWGREFYKSFNYE